MEIHEKRVLRRKMPLLAKVMTDNGQFLTACVTQGLLTKEQLKTLKSGGVVSTEQVMSFIAILEQGTARTNFARLIYALQNAGLKDAIDELQVELMSEKKQLSPPETLTKETRLLTNKLFTGHRVLKPTDAAEVGALLAERYMVATEIGQRRLDRYRQSVVRGQGGLLHGISSALGEVNGLIKAHFADAVKGEEEAVIEGPVEETPGECGAHCYALAQLRKRVETLVGCIEEMALKHEAMVEEQRRKEEEEEDEEESRRNGYDGEEDEDSDVDGRRNGRMRNGVKTNGSGSQHLSDSDGSGHLSGSGYLSVWGGPGQDGRPVTSDEVDMWRRKVTEKEIVIAELLRTLHESRHVEEVLRGSSTALRQHCTALERTRSQRDQLNCTCSLCERQLNISQYECNCAICRMRRLAFDGSGR